MIAITIDDGNSTYFAEDAASGLIADIDASVSMNCADKPISGNAANWLIDTPINAYELIVTPIDSTPTDSMDCADTNVSDDAVDGLMILMGWLL